MSVRIVGLVPLVIALSCAEPEAAPDPGLETGPCIAGECLGGLVCASETCVQPGGTSGTTDSGAMPGSGGGGTNTSTPVADDAGSDTQPSPDSTSADESSTGAVDPTDPTDDATDSTGETGPPVGGCGDGALMPGEQCDGANLQGFTCRALGLGGGVLTCDPVTCSFDTSLCTGGGSGTGG